MVQIIPRAQQPTIGEQLAGGLISGSQRRPSLIDLMQQKIENQALSERFGDIFKGIRSPDTRKQLLSGELGKESLANKLASEYQADEGNYQKIKEAFGSKFADVWRAVGQGERTALVQGLLKAKDRGLDVDEFLRTGFEEEPSEGMKSSPSFAEENVPIDFTKKPKGISWSEWNKEKQGWAKKNTETLESARDRLKGNKRDVLGTKKLQKLEDSGKLPSGFERLIINPDTGSPYGAAQIAGLASPEAQEWVKEIARFGNRAKDAYGSRVTNFDLQQYMKQFPSLLNTSEGRRRILRMMEINYDLDSLYDSAVQQIIDDYGEDKIPPAQVDKIARKLIKNREQNLFDEYLNIESENENAFMSEGMSRPSLEDIFGG